MKTLKVAIIGAGVGGLCLAQGLRRAGLDVKVFERDLAPATRLRGYRLSISPMGSRAIAACVGPEAFARLTRQTSEPSRTVTFLDHRLRRLCAFELAKRDRSSPESERPIGRLALRKALLDGLEDAVEFGKTFANFEERGEGVVARFADGAEIEADIVVGADGASSALRRQLLPGPAQIDTGVLAIAGKRPLDAAGRAETPPSALTGPTMVMGPNGHFLFCGAVTFGDLQPDEEAPEEYVTWGMSAQRAQWPSAETLEHLKPEALQPVVLDMLKGWEPSLRQIVEKSDPATLSAFAVKSAAPVEPWRTRRVTLMGDALHSMPPFQGVGANAALWDAEVLCSALTSVARGETLLIESLAAYEKRAIEHGFALVERSMQATRRFHSTNPLARAATKTFFRALDRFPVLRTRAFGER